MSLQDLCIDVIVKNFERFFLAFCTTKNVYLKMHFEFLQKFYSHQIIFLLNASDKMQPKYVDLVINKYLTVLDTRWFEGVPWETIVEKFAEIGPNIQKISFDGCTEETPWQTIIHHLINLEVMNNEYNCTDEILNCIVKFCPKIVEIDVKYSLYVTNEGIKYLCMEKSGILLCPKLKKLFISCTSVDEDGVKYFIKTLRSLEETDCHVLPEVLYSLHENDMEALDKIEPYNITNLDFSHLYSLPYYTNLIKVCLTLCPHLKSLSCSILIEYHLDLISGPFELEKLYLKSFLNPELDITNFLKLKGKKLTSLSVSSCSLSVSTLAESCPSLKQLNLVKVIFKKDYGTSPLFHHLEKCTFENCSSGLLLESSPILKHIAFNLCDLPHNSLKTAILKCAKNCPLKEVIFSLSVIDINYVKDILLSCPSLKWLKVHECLHEEHEELHQLAKILPNNPVIEFESDGISSDFDDDFIDSYSSDSDVNYEDFAYFGGDE